MKNVKALHTVCTGTLLRLPVLVKRSYKLLKIKNPNQILSDCHSNAVSSSQRRTGQCLARFSAVLDSAPLGLV